MLRRGVLLLVTVCALGPVPVAGAGEDPEKVLRGSGRLHPREFFPANSETATYIGPPARSVITVRESMPPMLYVRYRARSGATLREMRRPRIAHMPMSPAMKSS